MKKNYQLFLAVVLVILMALSAGCSSSNVKPKENPTDSKDKVASTTDKKDDKSTESKEKNKEAEKKSEPEVKSDTAKTTFDFEGSLKSWAVSKWQSGADGELACTKVAVSKDQKSSGESSAAVTCAFSGIPGSAKTTKGSFQLNLQKPANLTGKTISAKVYIPEEILAAQFKESSYGLKLYIKTTDSWSWSDGGWVDIANKLKAGWNEIKFSPKNAKEEDTREIGIQIVKGDKTADWSGTIYIDDISY